MYLSTPYIGRVLEGTGYILFISLSLVPRIFSGIEEVNKHFILKNKRWCVSNKTVISKGSNFLF